MQCHNCGQEVRTGSRFCPKCGTPFAAAAPEPEPYRQPYQPPAAFGDAPRPQFSPSPQMGPTRKSFGCGKIILILLAVFLLIGGGIAALVYFGYRQAETALKSSEAYMVALKALKENSKVAEKMGEIKDTGFPLGSYSENGDGSGHAAYSMSVEGTKAKGTYKVVMRRSGGKWRLMAGNVALESGETITLLGPDEEEDEGTPGDADEPSTDEDDNTNTNRPPGRRVPSPPPLPSPTMRHRH